MRLSIHPSLCVCSQFAPACHNEVQQVKVILLNCVKTFSRFHDNGLAWRYFLVKGNSKSDRIYNKNTVKATLNKKKKNRNRSMSDSVLSVTQVPLIIQIKTTVCLRISVWLSIFFCSNTENNNQKPTWLWTAPLNIAMSNYCSTCSIRHSISTLHS